MERVIMDALESLGLSEKEVLVYVSLLELGESSVNKITERSELNRTTIYPVLKSLINKGFVSKFITERKTHFKTISPRQIVELIKEKVTRIKSVVPLLEAKANIIDSSTSIELFRGNKAFFSFIEKLYLGDEREMRAYGNFDVAKSIIEYQALHGRHMRMEKGIKLNIIISPFDDEYIHDKNYRKITNIRVNQILRGVNIYVIFGRKRVGIVEVTKEIVGIIIENEEIAKYHKFVYDLLVKGSKKV